MTKHALIVAIILVLTSSAIPAGMQIYRMSGLVLNAQPNMPDDSGAPLLSSIRFISIGSRSPLLEDVLDAVNGSGASLVLFPSIPDLGIVEFDLNGKLLIAVLFDGDWMQSKAGNASLGRFLKGASSEGILLAAIAGHTSSLFDQFNQSGIYVFKPGRNPAGTDPGCVAFRRSEQVDSTYICNSFSVADITKTLANSASDAQAISTPVYRPALGEANLTLVRRFQYTPLLASAPHGKLSVSVDVFKLLDDGTSAYDWYYFFVTLRSQAGLQVYGSDWLTADIGASHVVFDPNGGTWHPGDPAGLSDYGPSTAYGTSVLDFTVDRINWRYDIRDIEVLDYSDYSESRAAWVPNMDEVGLKPSAMYTYQAEPLFVAMVRQDCPVYVDASYYINLGHVQWFLIWPYWEYYNAASSALYFDALRTTDS